MERNVYPGEFYRHFKNKLYQIVAVASHSETGERMVVYQALYGDYRTYVRPYDMFVSEVDHEKYPEVTQKYRFERVELSGAGAAETVYQPAGAESGLPTENPAEIAASTGAGSSTAPAAPTAAPSPAFLRFLEVDSYELRMECLKYLEQSGTQTELDSIYLVLDMKPEGGTVKEQVGAIRRFLTMQAHFDGNRLR